MTTTGRAWFLVHPSGLVVRRDGDGRITLPTDNEVATLGVTEDVAHHVGRLGEADAMAAPITADAKVAPPMVVAGLRELYSALGPERFAMAGRAHQIVEWATTSRFCGRCATPTERVPEERCMRCPICTLVAYPRIAPAIIVLVRRGEEALLARGARFPAAWFSTLAGFAEVGETLEETLAREVREEVGIEVKDTRYFGSQSWPFPHSLMIGFTAAWAGGDIRADGKEILEASWFRPDALPPVPPRVSIARALIDAWVNEVMGRR